MHANLKALGTMVNNAWPKDDNEETYSDAEWYDICDARVPQNRTRNDGGHLLHSLAPYTTSQREVGPWPL